MHWIRLLLPHQPFHSYLFQVLLGEHQLYTITCTSSSRLRYCAYFNLEMGLNCIFISTSGVVMLVYFLCMRIIMVATINSHKVISLYLWQNKSRWYSWIFISQVRPCLNVRDPSVHFRYTYGIKSIAKGIVVLDTWINSYSIYVFHTPMTLIEVPAWKYLVLLPILSSGNKITWIYIWWFPCNINKIGQGWWDWHIPYCISSIL